MPPAMAAIFVLDPPLSPPVPELSALLPPRPDPELPELRVEVGKEVRVSEL